MNKNEKTYLWIHRDALSRIADETGGDVSIDDMMMDTVAGARFRARDIKEWSAFKMEPGQSNGESNE